jgi:DNA-binding NarL/FixJ family response regulator
MGVVSDLTQLLDHVQASPPDVVLMRMGMQGCLDTLQTVVRTAPAVKVIMLGVSESEDEVITCAEAGVAGYLPRTGSVADLLDVLRSVSLGETLCSPRVAATLLRRIATLADTAKQWHAPSSPNDLKRLTMREREILTLIDQRLSNKEIALRLSIDVRTVKNHVHNILQKLQVHRRGEAARRMGEADLPVRCPAW